MNRSPIRRPRLRRLRSVVAVLLASIMLSGCEFDVYSLPLPGGADVGDDPITVTVEFADVLDLVPKSAVKYNEVNVGQVTDVELGGEDDRTAIVTIALRRDADLPENATASIRQTSLLGEKFVSLDLPTSEAPSSAPLDSGDVIPLSRTGRNPEIEEVLGALSLILNGGGVAQLKTISNEINIALEGREDTAKSVLKQIQSLVGQLDRRKGDITRALEAVNTLAVGVRKQQRSIDQALDELPSAVDSLSRQRKDLVRMLVALNRLSNVGTRVIREVKGATIESLRLLLPVLTQLGRSGRSLAYSMQTLAFPFVDAVVGRDPQVAKALHLGDYVNLSVEMDIDLANPQLPTVCVESLQQVCNATQLNKILTCIQKPSTCSTLAPALLDSVCNTLPLPTCRPTAARSAEDDGAGGAGGGGVDLGGLGLNRAPVGGRSPEASLPDLGAHDPVLVGLLGTPLLLGGGAR